MNINNKINLDHPEDVTNVLNELLDALPDFQLTKSTLLAMYDHIRNYKTKQITSEELKSELAPFFAKKINYI